MKILVLGASHSEFHLSQTIRELGHEVVHLARGEMAFCDRLASRIPEDYSDSEKVQDIAEAGGFDRVVSGANDFASKTASQTNIFLGKNDDSSSQWEAINLKDGLNALQLKLGLPSLVALKIEKKHDFEWPLEFPVMIKATNLTGGKGVSLVSSQQELERQVSDLFAQYPSSEFMLQEPFGGPLYSVTGLVVEGAFVPLIWFREFAMDGAYWIKSAVSLDPSLESDPKIFFDIEQQLSEICRYLDLAGGIIHCQFTFEKGRSVIFDLTRRIPGDMLVRVIELALGAPWFKILVAGVLFEPISNVNPPGHKGGLLRHCLTGKVGRIVNFNSRLTYPGRLLEHFTLVDEGSAILEPSHKIAIDFVQLDLNVASAHQSVAALAQRLEY
jgi:hypothetical protein